ncbi:plasmid replication protein RepC [Salipiger sp. PrR002]|uniref:plasmid replication protein RepC n=1 Tax=Salipiger sp. PrR002 TaxID=2706489 RepID=UPI0013B89C33|nr:plasmid replication protein RepC [Salipiger sp. PrR002]NDW01122.1 replication initiation protein [Salipiger sp. PrR002]NDW57925.1 replication initiation protein [Salipiger sp. PrR004]
MGYHPITPFGRSAEAVLASVRARPSASNAPCAIDKWQILRDLTTARKSFDLSDRDITLLQALLSFHPEARLDAAQGLVIHPSNETICARANGMPNSTMRRHLARLVAAGLLIRRDSPNGKRYARRVSGQKIAFGFDLSPLLHRAAEIAERASEAREHAAQIKALRDTASLLRRDLAALADLGRAEQVQGPWDAFSDLARLTARDLRRQLDREELEKIGQTLHEAVTRATRLLDFETPEMSTSAAQNEQHQQKSQEDSYDSESPVIETSTAEEPCATSDDAPDSAEKREVPPPPLRLILNTCSEIAVFTPDPIHDWHSLVRAAEKIRPMTGISDSAWTDAKKAMGPEQAAATLCAMLQRFSDIRNPGGYLRHLTRKAREGTFSASRMVMALDRRAA